MYDYGLALPNWALAAGVPYWISIYTNDSPSNSAWANSGDGTSDGAVRYSGGPWNPFDNAPQSNHVLFLTGEIVAAVPSPPTSALFSLAMLAMAGMIGLRRRLPARVRIQ